MLLCDSAISYAFYAKLELSINLFSILLFINQLENMQSLNLVKFKGDYTIKTQQFCNVKWGSVIV